MKYGKSMNKAIDNLIYQSGLIADGCWDELGTYEQEAIEKLAELIVAECRNVVTEVYRKTPLELCGPLLTADEEIAKHFYGVEE
jgi:hypothetical protein